MDAETPTRLLMTVCVLAGTAVAAVCGHFYSGIGAALILGTVFATLGACSIAGYELYARSLRCRWDRDRRMAEAFLLAIIVEGLATTVTPEQADQKLHEVQKNLERAMELVGLTNRE